MQDTGVLHTSHRLAEYERRIEKSKIIQKGEIKNKIKMHDCKIVAKMWIVSQLFLNYWQDQSEFTARKFCGCNGPLKINYHPQLK